MEDMSPFLATSLEVCEKFSQTSARRSILIGFLELRCHLREIEIVNGFQWLDGCFIESGRRKRKEPDHIQVVTFFHPPLGFPKPEHHSASRR